MNCNPHTLFTKECTVWCSLQYLDISEMVKLFKSEVKNYHTRRTHTKYGIVRLKKLAEAMPFEEIEEDKTILIMTKDFLEKYKGLSFGQNSIDECRAEAKDAYEAICNGDTESYVFVKYNEESKAFCDVYGKSLERPVRYNNNDYMVTDAKYDLDRLLDYLKTKDNVLFSAPAAIRDIPHRHASKENTRYINFHVRLRPEQLANLTRTNSGDLPDDIIDLRPFLLEVR